jgi:hypothetical protein
MRRRLIPLLVVSSFAAVVIGLSWLKATSGQDKAGRKPWRAIGAIYPRISAAGEAIVFSYQGAIWRMGREGGVMHRLTSEPGFDIDPAWSLDGKRVAYVNSSSGELHVIDGCWGISG